MRLTASFVDTLTKRHPKTLPMNQCIKTSYVHLFYIDHSAANDVMIGKWAPSTKWLRVNEQAIQSAWTDSPGFFDVRTG